MDRSDQPTTFRGAIRDRQSRLVAIAVVAGVVGLAGLSWLSGLTSGPPEPPVSTATPRAAVGSPTPRSTSRATPRPTPRPTPEPTPAPTLPPTPASVTSEALQRTGIEVVGTGGPGPGDLVADANGTIWFSRAATLVNLDPQTGRTREWTLADDLAFGAGGLAPARLGGVWLVGPGAIRLFDGERFRAVIRTPVDVWGLAEAPDGTLWVQTGDYGLIRWADGRWTSDPPGRPARGASDLAVDTAGRLWVTNYRESEQAGWVPMGVSVWDGEAWTTYANDDLPAASGETSTLLPAPDGSVWAGSYWLLARFDGARWSQVELPDRPAGRWRLSAVDEGGRLWFVEEDCEGRIPAPCRIQVLDGSTVTSYDTASGLPESLQGWGSMVLAGPGYVVASTDAGLYRLDDGSWDRIPTPQTEVGLPSSWGTLEGWSEHRIAAVSGHEVWAVTEQREGPSGETSGPSLVVFDGSAWRRELLPGQAVPSQVVASPDGSLWVAADTGPLLRRHGVWVDLGGAVEDAVSGSVGGDCNAVITLGPDGAVYYVGPRSQGRVVALRASGTAWRASPVGEPGPNPDCPTSLAVTADGTIWNLQRGWGSMLSRLGDEGWVQVLPNAEGGQPLPTAMAVGPEGSLWVVAWTPGGAGGSEGHQLLEIRDLRWADRGPIDGLDYTNDLAALPDGSLAAVGAGLAVRRDGSWQALLRGVDMQRVSIAPDGTVWALGDSLYRLPMRLP